MGSRTLNRGLFLLGISIFINYLDRSNLSLAAPLLKVELGLSPAQLGVLLSAFFWTYSTAPLVAGWLVDRYEPRRILAAGFFVWTVATLTTGLLHTFVALLTARIVLGLGESVAYPCYSKIIGMHFAEERRGTANSAVSVGQALGPMAGLLFGAPLIAHFGWRYFFLAIGIVSLLWLWPWLRWLPPAAVHAGEDAQVTIWEILKQRPACVTFLTLFCMNYYSYFMLTWLPYYLVQEQRFSLIRMSYVAAAMFLCAAISAASFGRLSDRLVSEGQSPTRVRKNIMVYSTAFTGVVVVATAFAPDQILIVLLLLAGVGFGATSSNTWAITQRLAGTRAVGRWTGMQLFVGNLAGVAAPALTGLILQKTGEFFAPFLVVGLVSLAGSVLWRFGLKSIEPVEWPSLLQDGFRVN